MARRRQSGLDGVAALPWPVGVVLGVIGFVAIRYGIGWYFGASDGRTGQEIADQASGGMLAPLAWLVMGLCWFAALVSYLRDRARRKLLDAQTGLESFNRAHWREFELLVGEAFRRQGYAVEETGLGGADGGIDLILRKSGRMTLVQVKRWRRVQVDVRVVREMYGLMMHHRADAVCIAALGGFTRAAERFARDKPIELIDAPALLALVSSVQQDEGAGSREPSQPDRSEATPAARAAPACPHCQATMTLRRNKASGEAFWGCSAYPACRGTRAASALD